MSDVLKAFPSRPLKVNTPKTLGTNIVTMIFVPVCCAAIVWIAAFGIPSIMHDYGIKNTAVPVEHSDISNGECRSHYGILVDCDMDATATIPGQGSVTKHLSYTFVSAHSGDFEVGVMADPKDPTWLTTDMGLDHVWDRMILDILVILFCAALIPALIFASIRNTRRRKGWTQGNARPVALRLAGIQSTRHASVWTVLDETGRKEKWNLPRKTKPFVIESPNIVLGMRNEQGSVFPVDSELKAVQLSDDERARILNPGSSSGAGVSTWMNSRAG